MMKRKGLLYFFILLFLIFNICCVDASEIFYGNWIISKELIYGPVVAIDEKEIKELVGKKIVYFKNIVSFDKHLSKSPKYFKESISEGDFLTGQRIPLKKLGINQKQVIKVEVHTKKNNKYYLWDSPGNVFYIKDKDVLFITYQGVYFKLIREQKRNQQ